VKYNVGAAKTPSPSDLRGKAKTAQRSELRKRVSQALTDARFEEAEGSLLELVQLEPESRKAHRDLARIYFRTGDYENAEAHAKLWNDPQDVRALIFLAHIYRITAKPSEYMAIGHCLLAETGSREAALEAARIFRDTDRQAYSVAVNTLERLLDNPDENDVEVTQLLRALSATGDDDAFWRAINSQSTRRGHRFSLVRAEHFIKTERFAEALNTLNECDVGLRESPDFAQLRDFAEDRVGQAERISDGPLQMPGVDAGLVDLFKRAEIDEFVVLHVDHFEPWQPQFDDHQLQMCEAFGREIARHEYSRKLSLFYCPGTPFAAGAGEPMQPGLECFGVVAPGRPATEQTKITEAMAVLKSSAEFHLHIHHEDLIPCAEASGDLIDKVERNIPRELHNALFELHVRANLVQLKLDTGVELDNWATIHGKWALNGSDRSVCTIDDEMCRLQSLGCWGDFTFPAGRRHCSPRWQAPFAVRPTVQCKAYDRLNTEVWVLGRDSRTALFGPERFFIWSSTIPYPALSLDYYSANAPSSSFNTDQTLQCWIKGGARDEKRIFVKTHAHSMAPSYRKNGAAVFPHFFPRNQRLFAKLERVCDHAGIVLRYATVNEVRQLLRS
jgi:tetratricopeptide (TPR) repeat protein